MKEEFLIPLTKSTVVAYVVHELMYLNIYLHESLVHVQNPKGTPLVLCCM